MLHIELVEDEFDDHIILKTQNLRDSFRDPRLDRPQVDLRHVNLKRDITTNTAMDIFAHRKYLSHFDERMKK